MWEPGNKLIVIGGYKSNKRKWGVTHHFPIGSEITVRYEDRPGVYLCYFKHLEQLVSGHDLSLAHFTAGRRALHAG